jgi:hypothetical protein
MLVNMLHHSSTIHRHQNKLRDSHASLREVLEEKKKKEKEERKENLKRLQAVLARVVVEVDYAPC